MLYVFVVMCLSRVSRTSLSDAVKVVLMNIPDKPISISELALRAGLNWRTVKKVLEIIRDTQKFLGEKMLFLEKVGKTYVVRTERRRLLSLPLEERVRYVRERYFPEPGPEELLLGKLFLCGAFGPDSAVKVEMSSVVERLLSQGQLAFNSKGEVYLTEEGRIVARGILKLYPEYF